MWQWEHSRFFNKRAFHQAHDFYEKYGGITIMLARFLPFIRTFVPFVAGVAEMSRRKFTMYNVAGALVWVVSLVTAGYLFGNLPWAKANMSMIIWAMIIVPGLIALFGAWKAQAQRRARRRLTPQASARRSAAAQICTAALASSMTRPMVMKPWICRSKQMCVHAVAGLRELVRILQRLVAQRVVAGGQHQRRRQLRQVGVQQRRGAPVQVHARLSAM